MHAPGSLGPGMRCDVAFPKQVASNHLFNTYAFSVPNARRWCVSACRPFSSVTVPSPTAPISLSHDLAAQIQCGTYSAFGLPLTRHPFRRSSTVCPHRRFKFKCKTVGVLDDFIRLCSVCDSYEWHLPLHVAQTVHGSLDLAFPETQHPLHLDTPADIYETSQVSSC